MKHDKKYRLSTQDISFGVGILLIIAIMFVISPYLPDERMNGIKNELTRQGYDVSSVDFEFVMDGDRRGEWIFQSSIPIYFNGYYVSEWSVIRYDSGFTVPYHHYRYHVKPHPPLPERVNLNITFSAEEFERIKEYADGQAIDEYLRWLALNH